MPEKSRSLHVASDLASILPTGHGTPCLEASQLHSLCCFGYLYALSEPSFLPASFIFHTSFN